MIVLNPLNYIVTENMGSAQKNRKEMTSYEEFG